MYTVKRIFEFAVSEELIMPHVYEGLRAVVGLTKGRSIAREAKPETPVSDDTINQTLPYVSLQVAAMIKVQRLTGMRPCEVTLMRKCDLRTDSDIWLYIAEEHKIAWRGHERVIPLVPKVQEILKLFLSRQESEYLFSPKEAEFLRNRLRNNGRKRPTTKSQIHRESKPNPKRAKRERYDTDSYRRAINYGIKKANRERMVKDMTTITDWFPLQIRHSRATEINETYGIEAAAVSLGHAHADITKVYTQRNIKLA